MDLPGRDRLEAYRQRLLRALLDPATDDGVEQSLPETARLPVPRGDGDDRSELAERDILAHTRAAAALGVLPVVDLIAVTTLQARMLRRLADLRGVEWNADLAREFIALMGAGVAGGIVGHTVGRSVLKIIPVIGQSAGAAWSARSSAVSTYAIGKAADYFLALQAAGSPPAARALRQVHARAVGSATAQIARLMGREGR